MTALSTLKATQSVVQAGEHCGTATPESLQPHLSDFRQTHYSVETAELAYISLYFLL